MICCAIIRYTVYTQKPTSIKVKTISNFCPLSKFLKEPFFIQYFLYTKLKITQKSNFIINSDSNIHPHIINVITITLWRISMKVSHLVLYIQMSSLFKQINILLIIYFLLLKYSYYMCLNTIWCLVIFKTSTFLYSFSLYYLK